MDLGIHDGLAILNFRIACVCIEPSGSCVSHQLLHGRVQILYQIIPLHIFAHLDSQLSITSL